MGDIYNKMIDKGRGLLDDSLELNKNNVKYVKFNKFLEENKDDPVIMTLYHKLQKNYNILLNTNNKDKFDQILENIYITEFELLVHVYRNKREKLNNEKKKQIELLINQIKQNKNEEKLWLDK